MTRRARLKPGQWFILTALSAGVVGVMIVLVMLIATPPAAAQISSTKTPQPKNKTEVAATDRARLGFDAEDATNNKAVEDAAYTQIASMHQTQEYLPPGVISYNATSREHPAPYGAKVRFGTLVVQIMSSYTADTAPGTGKPIKVIALKMAFECLEPTGGSCDVVGLYFLNVTGKQKDRYGLMSPGPDDNGIAGGARVAGGATLTGTVAFPLEEPISDLALVIGNGKQFGYLALE